MANNSLAVTCENEPLRHSDLHQMATSMLDNIKSLLQPLQSLTIKLDDTKNIIDAAMKLANTVHSETRYTVSEQEEMKCKILALEMEATLQNLKFRGFSEEGLCF